MILCISVPELLEHLDQIKGFFFSSCSGYISCSFTWIVVLTTVFLQNLGLQNWPKEGDYDCQ